MVLRRIDRLDRLTGTSPEAGYAIPDAVLAKLDQHPLALGRIIPDADLKHSFGQERLGANSRSGARMRRLRPRCGLPRWS